MPHNFPSSPEQVLIRRLCNHASTIAAQYFRTPLTIEHKSAEQPVTIADREIERTMRQDIARAFPDDGIYGEEFGVTAGSSGRVWVLDPIDGTKAFITGMPSFASLIALYDRQTGQVSHAAVHMPALGETWFAASGQGCVWQRQASALAPYSESLCHVAGSARLQDCIITSTTPEMFQGTDMTAYRALTAGMRGRRYGGDAYAYGLLAAGYFDFVIEADLQPYDFLAPSLVVQEAGGVMTDWRGQALTPSSDGRVLAGANAKLHSQALGILQQALDS